MIAAVLLSIVPMDSHLVRDSVDSAESNAVHSCDWEGPRYTQWILGRDGEICDWRMDVNCSVAYHPMRIYLTDGNRVRVIRPLGIIGTVSNWDRETKEREWLPEEKRRRLGK